MGKKSKKTRPGGSSSPRSPTLPVQRTDSLARPKQPLSRSQPQQSQPPQRTASLQVTRQRTEIHAGPLPHPAVLRQYDEIIPDGADRILSLVERQTDHRIDLEKKVVYSDARRADWGVIAGLLVAGGGMGFGYALLVHGHAVAGSIFAGGTITTLVGTFVYGTKSRREERIKKTKIMTGQEPDDE
jgi:uncharacterized membrane protein